MTNKPAKTPDFIKIKARKPPYRKVEERIHDFEPVELSLSENELALQASRCTNCGTPFCHGYGCPLSNRIPEVNYFVKEHRWSEAAETLLETNNFPEFTGRVCPALCEASCVLEINDNPVSIKAIELGVIEKAFELGLLSVEAAQKSPDASRVAVIGSGPAGLTVADILNSRQCEVTIFEKAQKPGGILRYGIPSFKLSPKIIDRRFELMRNQGIRFETEVEIGSDMSASLLLKKYDVICLAAGARKPRDLKIPGRNLHGIHFAMDYLGQAEPIANGSPINITDKHVVIIGGGDTGADCLGTAIRQGAKSITQLEIMPEPPDQRTAKEPWPQWPRIKRDSFSHKEGGKRLWTTATTRFIGHSGKIEGIRTTKVNWSKTSGGQWTFSPVPGSETEIPADTVLLAMGFEGFNCLAISEALKLQTDSHGNISTDKYSRTNVPEVFAVGDVARGQSLVVKAIADARKASKHILEMLNS